MKNQTFVRWAVVVFALLVFMELKGSWLIDPDEPRYAEIPREMMATGDYLTPRLNGSHYFEKPPLLYWLNAASMKILGETPFATRLPARVAGIGTALLLIFLLPLERDPLIGWWAALLYLSAPLSFALSRVNLTDGPLTFGLTLTFLSLRKLIHSIEEREKTGRWYLLIGLGAAIAVLSKGPVGLVLPGLVFLIWIGMAKKWGLLKKLLLSPAPLVFLALAAPWFIFVGKANPGFTWFFFVHEHLLRYATKEAMRQEPFYFFVVTFLWGFLPWLYPFLSGVIPANPSTTLRASAGVTAQGHADGLFFKIWFFVIVVFFSISQSKLIPYILPAFPAAAALAATGMMNSEGEMVRWLKWQIPFWAVAYSILIFFLPHFAKSYSEHDLATAALQSRADHIVAYQCYPQSFSWVLKHPIPVANFRGELASDGIKSPDLFWDAQTFWDHWNSNERMAVCISNRDLDEFNKQTDKKVLVLGKSRRSALLANFKPA